LAILGLMSLEKRKINENHLPWWTWIAPFFIIEVGDVVSLLFRYSNAYSSFYLPTALGIVLVHWWGPKRVLPSFFIIATFNSWHYDIQTIWLWFAFGVMETGVVWLSWYLFTKRKKGNCSLPDTFNTLSFLAFGIFIPITLEVSIWEFFYHLDGMLPLQDYWERFSRDLLSEFIANLSVGLLALYALTPVMNKWNLLLYPQPLSKRQPVVLAEIKVEIVFIAVFLLSLIFFLPFDRFWFVYGLFSFYLAIRFGFGMAVTGNAILFFVSYLLPLVLNLMSTGTSVSIRGESVNTYLGTLLMYVFATVTGRVISDLKIVKAKLSDQNAELKEINLELDRFVYSVSHDLSAPLKSIMGLVNISKLSNSTQEHRLYFDKIGASVSRLDQFIKEVLEYSQNQRLELIIEPVDIKEVCLEIFENLKYMDSEGKLVIDLNQLQYEVVSTDRSRVKIILNNLLTNAVKYQKRNTDHKPVIRVASSRMGSTFVLKVEDNGEGIRKETLPRIFSMFFRGHETSTGSGLGLYIAREAAEKIGATLSVTSDYGIGSVFTLEFKQGFTE
jgi:two-component system, sensor histidine kinase